MNKKILLASNNQGKLHEIKDMLLPFSIDLISQADLNINEVAETGLTFVENALLKARYVAQQSGLPALADDSGLVVDALNGQPGIYSARYAGANARDQMNIDKLLAELVAIPQQDRTARFYCVLVLMRDALDPVPIICQGVWSGEIALTPKGENGFGYDPIFYLPELKCTAAELTRELKNKLSHRGQALRLLMSELQKIA